MGPTHRSDGRFKGEKLVRKPSHEIEKEYFCVLAPKGAECAK